VEVTVVSIGPGTRTNPSRPSVARSQPPPPPPAGLDQHLLPDWITPCCRPG